jgi:hypothetical protein
MIDERRADYDALSGEVCYRFHVYCCFVLKRILAYVLILVSFLRGGYLLWCPMTTAI